MRMNLSSCMGLFLWSLVMPTTMAESIFEVAAATGQFNTLVGLLEQAGLIAMLEQQEGPFTVFAPTDEAFARFGSEKLAEVMGNPITMLGFITGHVIDGVTLTTADMVDGEEYVSLGGTTLTARFDGDQIFINDSEIVVKDLIGDDGVVHGIDTVLGEGDPNAATQQPDDSTEPDESTLPTDSGSNQVTLLWATVSMTLAAVSVMAW